MASTVIDTEWLTLDDLCDLAGMSKSGYRSMRQLGKTPPAYRRGKRLVFRRSDVDTWLATTRITRAH